MRLILTSKLRVCQCCVSMHAKVNISTRLWHLNNSIGWRKYIRFWDQDHSAGWRKFIRLWDLDHSAGCRKATRCIPREMFAKNHRPGVEWLCQQQGSEKNNSTCPTKRDNLEATCLPLLAGSLSRERRSCKSNSTDSGWCPAWRGCHSRPRNTWLQRITVDTLEYLRTAFVDAFDRDYTTCVIIQAEHEALNYWIASTC